MAQAATEVFERIGIDIDPNVAAGSLSVGMQQLVEVAKAISIDAKLLIMDEPTSSLSEREIDDLFKVIVDLRGQGRQRGRIGPQAALRLGDPLAGQG